MSPLFPQFSACPDPPSSPSSLRKPHESVSDPKYDAVRISRKSLYTDSEDEHEDADELESGHSSEDRAPHEQDELSEGETEDEEELQSPASDDDEAGSSDSEPTHSRIAAPKRRHLNEAPAPIDAEPSAAPDAPQPEGDIASRLRLTHEADKKKGKAVSRQIVSSAPHPPTAAFSSVCRQRVPGTMGHIARRTYPASQGRHRR